MKILCPVDFSIASMDAVEYALSLWKNNSDLEIDILHCIYPGNISGMFKELKESMFDHAQNSLKLLVSELTKKHPGVLLNNHLISGDPVTEISTFARKHGSDYITIGTKGINAAKNRLLGNVTENLFEKSQTPILAIPQAYVHHQLKNVILAVDDELISSSKIIQPLTSLLRKNDAKLHVLHVREEKDRTLDYDLDLDVYLEGISYDYISLKHTRSLDKEIEEICNHHSADLLCMIHRHRGWMLDLMHQSQVKKELLHLSTPVLILHD